MRVQSFVLQGLLLALLVCARPGHAAQSYDNCSGTIASLPAVISTQGTWCLKSDLTTAITTGNAITINTNNVTIDCNDFKLGGLAAGVGTSANGIYANNRINATVRHCNIRGFYYGLFFTGASGGGHAVEDNRFDGNTYTGLQVEGDGSVLRRNRVFDTGGSTVFTGWAYGITTLYGVDLIDNTIDGVLPTAHISTGNGTAVGISADNNPNGSITGNRVRGLVPVAGGFIFGIYNNNGLDRLSVRDNDIGGDPTVGAGGTGLHCGSINGHAMGNIVNGFAVSMFNCRDDGNSL